MKTCCECREAKPLSDFYKNSKTKDGRATKCGACSKAYAKRYAAKNREVLIEKCRQHYAANRDKLLVKQRRYRVKNLDVLRAKQRERVSGFSEELTEATLKTQGGGCGICEKALCNKTMQRDHCHISGMPRGLLCVSCNTALGKFKDSPLLLSKAIQYLTNPPTMKGKVK